MLHSVHEWQMYQYKNSFSFEKKKHHSFVIASYISSLLRILLHVFGIYSYMYKRGIYWW